MGIRGEGESKTEVTEDMEEPKIDCRGAEKSREVGCGGAE